MRYSNLSGCRINCELAGFQGLNGGAVTPDSAAPAAAGRFCLVAFPGPKAWAGLFSPFGRSGLLASKSKRGPALNRHGAHVTTDLRPKAGASSQNEIGRCLRRQVCLSVRGNRAARSSANPSPSGTNLADRVLNLHISSDSHNE